jgi:hypothetical protein
VRRAIWCRAGHLREPFLAAGCVGVIVRDRLATVKGIVLSALDSLVGGFYHVPLNVSLLLSEKLYVGIGLGRHAIAMRRQP